MRLALRATIALLFIPLTTFAQPLADKIPDDAIVYVAWRGSASMGPAFAESHLKAMMDLSNVADLFDTLLPNAMKAAGNQSAGPGGAEVAEAMQALGVVAPALWKYPSAFYFGGIDLKQLQHPMPKATLLCDAGADAPKLLAFITKLLAAAKDSPIPITAKAYDTVVVIEVADAGVGKLLAAKAQAGTLIASAKFKASTGSLDKEPVVAAYVDIEAALALFDNALNIAGDPQAKAMWPKVRDAVGLPALKRIGATAGFDGKDWSTQFFLEAPAPRHGLIAGLLEAKPLAAPLLAAIPQSATVAAAGNFDLARLYDEIRTSVGDIDADALGQLDSIIAEINRSLGFDLRADLFASLGSQWAVYSAPEIGGSGGLGTALLNHLADAPKADKTLLKVEDLANRAMLENMKNSDARLSVRDTTVGDLTIHYFGSPIVSPAWSIQNGNLYAGLYPQVVEAAADHVTAKGKSILDNAAYLAMVKKLGAPSVTSVTFLDLPKTAAESYPMLLLVSRASLGFADLMGGQSPPLVIPPLRKILPHLTQAGSVAWLDDAGWHLRSTEPFPGSQMFGGQLNALVGAPAAIGAVGAAVMLPALNRVRTQTMKLKSANNLRQIGNVAFLYANEHKGALPDNLGQLIAYDLPPEIFVSPITGHTPPPDLAAAEKDEQAKWVTANADYIYKGAGKKIEAADAATTVLAHEKAGSPEGGNILFLDGHVEWQDKATYDRTIAAGHS